MSTLIVPMIITFVVLVAAYATIIPFIKDIINDNTTLNESEKALKENKEAFDKWK